MAEKTSNRETDLASAKAPHLNIKAEGYTTIYCNSTKMAMSPWDIRITLGEVIERVPNEMINQDLVTFVVSPQHAKAILDSLTTTVKLYEDTFGKIPDVRAMVEQVDTSKVVKVTKGTVTSR